MNQPTLFEKDELELSLLDRLFSEAKLYRSGEEFKELLDFVVRLRNFAPFNAMLLHVQKPGLMYAASAKDWGERFSRFPKPGARPLLILQPFGPVALVYDVADTAGKEIPSDVVPFQATGRFSDDEYSNCVRLLNTNSINYIEVDEGMGSAGSIRIAGSVTKGNKSGHTYQIRVNKHLNTIVKFSTLAHELGHLFLGHLGSDGIFSIPNRRSAAHSIRELEAESVAFLVCKRQGIQPNSQKYLSQHVNGDSQVDDLEPYRIMKAAGDVQRLIGLNFKTKF